MKTLFFSLLIFSVLANGQSVSLNTMIRDTVYVEIAGNALDPESIKRAVQQAARDQGVTPQPGETRMSRVFLKSINPETGKAMKDAQAILALTASQGFYKGESDKQKHILVGGLITASTSTASEAFFRESMSAAEARRMAQITGVLANITAAAAKEIYDGRNPRHTRDVQDFMATVMGSGLYFGLIKFEF